MGIKKIVFLVVIVVSFFVINSLIRSIYSLWQKENLVVDARLELEREQLKNRQIKERLGQVGRQEFVEGEARDKPFLAKPGEKIIVMPSVYLRASPSAAVVPGDKRENWERWREELGF